MLKTERGFSVSRWTRGENPIPFLYLFFPKWNSWLIAYLGLNVWVNGSHIYISVIWKYISWLKTKYILWFKKIFFLEFFFSFPLKYCVVRPLCKKAFALFKELKGWYRLSKVSAGKWCQRGSQGPDSCRASKPSIGILYFIPSIMQVFRRIFKRLPDLREKEQNRKYKSRELL